MNVLNSSSSFWSRKRELKVRPGQSKNFWVLIMLISQERIERVMLRDYLYLVRLPLISQERIERFITASSILPYLTSDWSRKRELKVKISKNGHIIPAYLISQERIERGLDRKKSKLALPSLISQERIESPAPHQQTHNRLLLADLARENWKQDPEEINQIPINIWSRKRELKVW